MDPHARPQHAVVLAEDRELQALVALAARSDTSALYRLNTRIAPGLQVKAIFLATQLAWPQDGLEKALISCARKLPDDERRSAASAAVGDTLLTMAAPRRASRDPEGRPEEHPGLTNWSKVQPGTSVQAYLHGVLRRKLLKSLLFLLSRGGVPSAVSLDAALADGPGAVALQLGTGAPSALDRCIARSTLQRCLTLIRQLDPAPRAAVEALCAAEGILEDFTVASAKATLRARPLSGREMTARSRGRAVLLQLLDLLETERAAFRADHGEDYLLAAT